MRPNDGRRVSFGGQETREGALDAYAHTREVTLSCEKGSFGRRMDDYFFGGGGGGSMSENE